MNIKTGVMTFKKITVSATHKQFHRVPQEFISLFHNSEPVIISSCLPLNGRIFFNGYSSIKPCTTQPSYNLNDSDATKLIDIESNALIQSIVGKLKFNGPVVMKAYVSKAGKSRTDKMRECLISDGSACLKITFWGDFVDFISENELYQITQCYSKTVNDAIVLSIDPSSMLCKLNAQLDCNFDQIIEENVPVDSIECLLEVLCIKKVELFHACKSCKKRLEIQNGTNMCT